MNIQNSLNQPKESKPLFLNPMIRKLSSINERSETVSTYGGIFSKFLYFLAMIIAGFGVAFYFYASKIINHNIVTGDITAEKFAIICILVAVGMFIIFPLLAFIIRKTIPVFGALYCVSTGFLLGCIMMLDESLKNYMMLALVLTFSIVLVMAILYFSGRIRVGNKFRTVTMACFSTMILSSLVVFICSFIPALKDSVAFLSSNPVISIGISLSGVIIASLFLLIDFDTIRSTVDNQLPKKYEWYAAFSVVFTIVWLYFKVLDLVMRIKDAKG